MKKEIVVLFLTTILLSTPACNYLTSRHPKNEQVGKASQTQFTDETEISTEDYQAAADLYDLNLRGTVKNERIIPHWINGTKRFWYRRDMVNGYEYVVIDTDNKTKSIAFDHVRLAETLTKLAGHKIDPANLPFEVIGLSPGIQLHASIPGRQLTCDLKSYHCDISSSPDDGIQSLSSPDGKQAVFIRDHNLWIKNISDGDEKALTTEGFPYYSFGKIPDGNLSTIVPRREGIQPLPHATFWSPDSRFLVSTRTDERTVETYPFVEWIPQDGSHRPILYQLRVPLLGDRNNPITESHIFDLLTGGHREISLPNGFFLVRNSIIGWRKDARNFIALVINVGAKAIRIINVDAATGNVRTLHEETADTHIHVNMNIYHRPNIRLVNGGDEIIWFSDKSDWGHLYLMDGQSGTIKSQITAGNWNVLDIIAIDEKQREIYFTAVGREDGRDPYYPHLYKADMDKGSITLLTREDAYHKIIFQDSVSVPVQTGDAKLSGPPQSMSPYFDYFIDVISSIDSPPRTVLRSTRNGEIALELENADASKLYERGWQPPQRFKVKSKDGKWDIYGVLYKPHGHKKGKKYPVIDASYGGPQSVNVPKSFRRAYLVESSSSVSSLVRLGFAVVVIDGRGTPFRSKPFQDIGYGNFADPALDDHVFAIKQLADKFEYIDLDRVGIYGHSFGGYLSARAILRHPDFYKVAVSSAGSHNFQGMYAGLETYIGIPKYSDGGRFRTTPSEIPSPYNAIDSATLAGNLKGKLMLVYGDMDENAYPAVTFNLVDALIKNNKTFDLLYLPNRSHSFSFLDTYYVRRMWDFFVTHLKGATPPNNFLLELRECQDRHTCEKY